MWTKMQLGHVEYLGWWTEQLDELKAVRCFVTDSLISVIAPGNKCSWLSFLRLNSSYLVFITLYFIKKRSWFFFLQNWNPDLQHECRSIGPPVLGEAGSCERVLRRREAAEMLPRNMSVAIVFAVTSIPAVCGIPVSMCSSNRIAFHSWVSHCLLLFWVNSSS